MKVRKPKKLTKGDCVGIVSPSGPVLPELQPQLQQGLSVLEAIGLKVKLGAHVLDHHFYNAGTRDDRIRDFNALWADPEVQMILMSQGGETANHLLDGIDYDLITRNPKIVAGISDGTTLLNAIFARTGVVTYHGPDLLWTFGRKMSGVVRENRIKTFFDGHVGELRNNPEWEHLERGRLPYDGWRCVRGGRTTGRLIGGHSDCFLSTMLAGYTADLSGAVLFLEGTDPIDALDRQFTALRLRGVFDQIAGLVIGWFENSTHPDPRKDRPVREVILEVTKGYRFPILEIGELGHNVENYVLPIGCTVTIDADTKMFRLDETTVL